MVEGGGSHQEEQLFDDLVDQALLHAVVAHGGVEDGELLQNGGDGVALRVVINTVGALPEACRFHAGDPL